jgi:hypothetical protein
MSCTSSVKAPDSNGRKTLGGIDGSRTDQLESHDCDEGNDAPGRVVTAEDDDCVEPGEKESINSVRLDQSKSCIGSEELPERCDAAKEVDRSGGSAGIVN